MGEEKSRTMQGRWRRKGSPPHGRGKVDHLLLFGQVLGITPAWARKRTAGGQLDQDAPHHPRVGEEKKALLTVRQALKGSPPRGRGKVPYGTVRNWKRRITPAWAGKRPSHCSERRRPQDHPRVGGEKHQSFTLLLRHRGSPPHGRGKGQLSVGHQIRERITPAWAGKRAPARARREKPQDHPRVGGEKGFFPRFRVDAQGSPPRGRGKGKSQGAPCWWSGITPAWAGKSLPTRARGEQSGDHPRVGGEKCRGKSPAMTTTGSPPRGRGKGVMRQTSRRLKGITPAWAGKSWGCWKHRGAPRDHPRVGGEKLWGPLHLYNTRGSPPRGRGKGGFNGSQFEDVGITPAWAGKSFAAFEEAARRGDHPRVGGEKLER